MKKIAIIGAGPIGLYFASQLENKDVEYTIFEATDKIGGQIVNLYPHKKFEDVDKYTGKEAICFVEDLAKKVDQKRIKFNEKIVDVKSNGSQVEISSTSNKYTFDAVVIAVGLGMYTHRTMGLENEDKCKNILYSLDNFSFLKDKKVAIFGGGDSALDWAKEISAISDNVHLVHRRTEFRGNPETITVCKNLSVHLPYVPFKLETLNDLCTKITIKNVNKDEYIDIPVDYVLVNYGSVPVNTPFNYPHEGNFLKADSNFALDKNVYAIGDCVSYQGKLRRIEPGKKEADSVLKNLFI